MDPVVGPPAISGRAAERQRLLDVVRGAVAGRPGAVLLHGEAGVGKTTLVRSVADEARRDGVQVLWGAGLRFDAADALFLPMTMALDGWLRDAEEADRERVLDGVPGVGALLPSMAVSARSAPGAGGESARPVGVVDALVSRILELGPVLLVVDDVQWADPASRAALAYLIAGFSRQRLALVTTHRDEDARGGEGFRTWVADMRRMPSVSVLQLDRLDREATRAQLTALLGARPGNGLVNQVFQRSQGNAYLTELLVSGMDPTAVTLPEGLPTALSEALLSAWHRLTLQARTLTRFLAVAGRPTAIATLRDVLIDLTGDDTLVGSLHEAVDAGIAVIEEANVWFRHPLLADVLIETFLPGESAPVHAAWARVLSRTSAAGLDEVRRLSALALHCEAAEDPRGAYDASIEAADLAEQHRELRDAARNLVRAAALWDDGAPDRDDMPALAALLERGATMCNRADQGPQAHALVTRALGVVDDGADPLRASRLLVEWTDLEWELGRTDEPLVEHVARAVELARTTPLSPEYAEALALLSIRLPWSRHEEAATLAEEAVAAARRSGSAKTLSAALGARAATSADVDRAGLDTEQALSCARTSGDDLCLGWAYVARANYLLRRGALGELIQVFREALDHAVEHGRGARESSNLADALLLVGDLPAAAEVVREGLPWSVKANDTVALRLSAAVLASRRGDRRLAEMHRTRAYEVMPSLERRVGATSTAAIAEILLARSEPEAALRLLHSVMPAAASDPAWLDELMVWGARAAADLVEAGDDARDPAVVTRARQRLADLVSLRATFPGTPYEPSCDTDPVQPAMGALFEAERGRSTGEGDLIELWRQAAAACQRAGLLWDHYQALWRLGVEFVRQHAPSAEAAAPLRAAHRYALEQGAVPFLHRVEETAALGRISLTEPVTPSRRAGSPAAFAQLTDRETEILAHLVANRTNAEIATELVISEKTVSVHVSNLLRKTSTGSRREVAALAVRLGWGSADAAG